MGGSYRGVARTARDGAGERVDATQARGAAVGCRPARVGGSGTDGERRQEGRMGVTGLRGGGLGKGVGW